MKKLFLIIPFLVLVGFVKVLTSYPTSGGAMGGSAISDSLGNTNELTLGASTDSAGYFIILGRDTLYYDTVTGQWYLSAALSISGVLDAYYGFFDSLKASTHAYFGYSADSAFYSIYGLRDTVVDYDTLGGAKLTVETATIKGDLYVKDSTFLNVVVDSGTMKIIGDLTTEGEVNLGNAITDTVTCTGYLTLPNDTILGDIVVNGAVKPAVVYWELLQDKVIGVSTIEGSSTLIYGALQGLTADSIIIDSIGIVEVTGHNDVYIDSINLSRGFTRAGDERTTSLYGDGTNLGVGVISYSYTNYVVGVTVAPTWRMMFQFWVATSGAGGSGYIISIKVYGHYQ